MKIPPAIPLLSAHPNNITTDPFFVFEAGKGKARAEEFSQQVMYHLGEARSTFQPTLRRLEWQATRIIPRSE